MTMKGLSVLVVVTICLVLCQCQTESEWEIFKSRFGKKYGDTKTESERKSIWSAHYKLIQSHNLVADKGLLNFRMEVNHLMDLTTAEYQNLLGARLINVQASATTTIGKYTTTKKPTTKPTKPTKSPFTTTTTAPPTAPSLDLRNSSCTPPIKNQGGCGSCWAFSATFETEYYNCMKRGSLTLLSEQDLVDCDLNNGGCAGGFYTTAWQYVIANGQCSSATYAYTATTGTCKRSSCTPTGTLTTYQWVPSDVSAIIAVLDTVGPVSVAIDAGLTTFGAYASGVYDDPACTTNINHAVNIVGYGTASDGTPYWIIRNSWGPYWGMGGYGFIKRGVNLCGIETWAAYPTA